MAASRGCATAATATRPAGAVVAAATAAPWASAAAARATTTGSGPGTAGRPRTPGARQVDGAACCPAWRRDAAATGPRGARSGCLRPRNRPLDRLRRGERVVADARCARRRLDLALPAGAGRRAETCGCGSRCRCGRGAGCRRLCGRHGCRFGGLRRGFGRRAFSGAGAFAAAALAGAPLPSALTLSAAGFAPPKDSRSRRATGSTVEDADLTNSPCSLSRASTSLLVTPSSLANSCTRALACHLLSCLRGDSGGGPRLGFSYDAWSSSDFTVCSCSSLPVLLPGAEALRLTRSTPAPRMDPVNR